MVLQYLSLTVPFEYLVQPLVLVQTKLFDLMNMELVLQVQSCTNRGVISVSEQQLLEQNSKSMDKLKSLEDLLEMARFLLLMLLASQAGKILDLSHLQEWLHLTLELE